MSFRQGLYASCKHCCLICEGITLLIGSCPPSSLRRVRSLGGIRRSPARWCWLTVRPLTVMQWIWLKRLHIPASRQAKFLHHCFDLFDNMSESSVSVAPSSNRKQITWKHLKGTEFQPIPCARLEKNRN